MSITINNNLQYNKNNIKKTKSHIKNANTMKTKKWTKQLLQKVGKTGIQAIVE